MAIKAAAFILVAVLALVSIRQSEAAPSQHEKATSLTVASLTGKGRSQLVADIHPATPVPPPQKAGNWREQFAIDLATGLNNPHPSPEIIAWIVLWTKAEDGGEGAHNRHNPLNTTYTGFGKNGIINGDGVGGYPTDADGLNATLTTLGMSASYPEYGEITEGIRTNDPARANRGLIASPWAESRYGGSIGWK